MFNNRRYTPEQDALILSWNGSAKELAELFGITTRAVFNRRTRLRQISRDAPELIQPFAPTFARPSWFEIEDIVAVAMSRRG